MSPLRRLLATEPALLLGFVQAAIALAVAFGAGFTPGQVGAITAFVAALLALALRQTVVAPTGLTEVARKTAEALSGPSAGAVGTVTKNGEEIINTVVSEVGGLAGGLAPKLGRDDAT